MYLTPRSPARLPAAVKSSEKRASVPGHIAAEMNYIPNCSAKSLVQRKSYTIGLFFSSLSQGTSASFFVDTIKRIRRELSEDYNLSVNGLDTISGLDSIAARRYDGILLMSQSDGDNTFIYHAKRAGIPLVVLNIFSTGSER